MVLFIHVATACASLLWAILAVARPSRAKIAGSFSLIAGTVGSGVWLVVAMQASVLRACVAGVTLVAVAYYLTTIAQSRLAGQRVSTK